MTPAPGRFAAYQRQAQARADECGLGDLADRTTTAPAFLALDELVFSRAKTAQITTSGARSRSGGEPVIVYPSARIGNRLVLGDGWHRMAEALERGETAVWAVIEPLGADTYDPSVDDWHPEEFCPACHLPDWYFDCTPAQCVSGLPASQAPDCPACGIPTDYLRCAPCSQAS